MSRRSHDAISSGDEAVELATLTARRNEIFSELERKRNELLTNPANARGLQAEIGALQATLREQNEAIRTLKNLYAGSAAASEPAPPSVLPAPHGRILFKYDMEGSPVSAAAMAKAELVIHEGVRKGVTYTVLDTKLSQIIVDIRNPIPAGTIHFFMQNMPAGFAEEIDYSAVSVEVRTGDPERRYKPVVTTEKYAGQWMGSFMLQSAVGGGGAAARAAVPPTRSLRIEGKLRRRLFEQFPSGLEVRCAGKTEEATVSGEPSDEVLRFCAVIKDIPYDDLSAHARLRVVLAATAAGNSFNKDNTYDVIAAVYNHNIEGDALTRVSVALIKVEGGESLWHVSVLPVEDAAAVGVVREVQLVGTVKFARDISNILYVRGVLPDKQEVAAKRPDGRVVEGKTLIEQKRSFGGCISTMADTALFERNTETGDIRVTFKIAAGDLAPAKPFRFMASNISAFAFPELDGMGSTFGCKIAKGVAGVRAVRAVSEADHTESLWEISVSE